MSRVLGAVLAGGQSRRFGSDKALALLDGVALIEHALAALAAQTDAMTVCGREYPGLACVADRPAPGLGPLGGLCAALAYAQRHGFDAVLSAGCDLAGLPDDLVARLASGPAYVADCPVVGLWPVRLAPALDLWLGTGEGDRSMRGWTRVSGARGVALDGIVNVNTPSDLVVLAGRV